VDYEATLKWLFAQQARGIKFGLDNTTELLSRLGDPHLRFRSLHVAGTNGKGSVSAMSAAVLGEAGYCTGLYTSPHLVDFRERIQVDGIPIGEKEMLRLAEEVRTIAEEMRTRSADKRLTFFELTTAMAFAHFADRGVEEAVVEVGMGGRLDATNVIHPECAVITRIALEHTQHLGRAIADIAFEKAGIIKPEVPVITIEQDPGVIDVLQRRAAELSSPIKIVGRDVSYELIASTLEGTDVYVEEIDANISLPLLGSYQAANCALACGGLAELMRRGLYIPDEAFLNGLAKVKWPGRLEIVGRGPCIILDASHTPDGARTVSEEVERLIGGKIILILGVLRDKDLDGIARAFGRISRRAVATAPPTDRAYSAEEVGSVLSAYCPTDTVDGVGRAIEWARSNAAPDDTILVTGSLYTIGEAKRWMNGQTG